MIDIKKNPRAVIENYSKIFFQIGLVLTLVIINFMMEYKTYDSDSSSRLGIVTMKEEMKEDIPIVMQQELPPPPPTAPVVMEQIKVVEDDLKIEESIIESTETDEKTAVFKSNTEIVEVREREEIIEDIPFVLIEDVPVFPGCKGNNAELKKCFSDKVTAFFGKNFDPALTQELGLAPGKKKIYVVFKINNKGKVGTVNARAPHPLLEKEVTRIITSLPEMKPGRQRGMPVTVTYSLPISIMVEE
ncbi:energy transducer TonB [Polaribacter gangjinensis]|uniref:energy transducer TonB n=1 Tax=Polaribacter gangjinensis TaxID=574710 RepID=UPI0021D4076D|nr:energy transducer TonB [Polaribacter gangjinensis]